MENDMELTALDDEFIAVELELKSTAADEELKCTSMEEEIKSSCQFCDKTFTNARTLNNHMRRIHNVQRTDPRRKIICPLSDCREKFFMSATLREHIVETHKIDLEVEEKTFPSYEDFRQWKENMERETNSHYVKKHSRSLTSKRPTSSLKEYFACHRSGFFTPNGAGKRNGRRVGSKRIGACCPSSLVVKHSAVNSYVKVEYWRKHLGHECDMNYLYLTRSEKMEIADKIKKGMTFTEILKIYNDSVSGPEKHRINSLTRRDLSNIVEKFKIKRVPNLMRKRIPKSDNDLVNMWVKNMEEFGNDSPIAFFTKQGMENEQLNSEDLMIVIMTKYQKEMAIKYSGKNICIDSIHGMSSHGFSLTALITIDELSAVLPLAFCISSKTDEVSMMVFFESVKRLVGVIETPVFMSNDDPAFYNAWEKIMAPASFQLLCNWHVDSCWHRELDKVSDKDKQASVYKALRMLLEESDVFKFESFVNNFVTELEKDASTTEFAEYFCKNYLPRVKMWAFCYMRHLGISTVEHLEAMHTSLKKLFLDRGEDDNVYKSVNVAIPALLKLSRDELLGRSDELLECLPADWSDRIHKSHQQGLYVRKVIALSNNSWSVRLFKAIDAHVVTENEACSQDVCYLRCLRCNICIHSFFCTCFDNLINLNICGHMHACARLPSISKSVKEVAGESEKMNEVITDGKEMVDTVVDNDEAVETSVDHEIPSSSKTLTKKSNNIKAILEKQLNTNKTIIEEQLSTNKTILEKQLNTIKTIMEYTDFTEEHACQLKNSFDAVISFMIMHGKSKVPFIQVPYKPTNNYLTTVNKKPQIQYLNQTITVGQPVCLFSVNNLKQT